MLLKHQKDVKADQWEIVEFPAIMDDGQPMWPEYWKKEELLKAKATLPLTKWNAQFMQRPTSEEGAIIKREWWREWKNDWIPDLHHVIQSYDTAFLKKEKRRLLGNHNMGSILPKRRQSSKPHFAGCCQGTLGISRLKTKSSCRLQILESGYCHRRSQGFGVAADL